MQCKSCRYEPTMTEMQASPAACPKCKEPYDKVKSASVQKTEKKPRQNKGVLTKFFTLFVLVAALVGGWKFYERHQAVEAIEAQVQLTSAYVTQMITAFQDSGSMTFSEFFEKANKSIAEIDASIVRVSVVGGASDTSAASVVYMKESQEVIRAISSAMRPFLALSVAQDRQARAEKDVDSSNSYISQYASKSRIEALDEQIKAYELIKASREKLVKAAESMRSAGEKIPSISKSALLAPPLFKQLTTFDK